MQYKAMGAEKFQVIHLQIRFNSYTWLDKKKSRTNEISSKQIARSGYGQ
jgi:hypothetical protein